MNYDVVLNDKMFVLEDNGRHEPLKLLLAVNDEYFLCVHCLFKALGIAEAEAERAEFALLSEALNQRREAMGKRRAQ